ncbi:hypothetical protein J7J00_27290 [Bacillus sp. ISL-4]|uniref:hypothetical protein n=1 Tax=Bacillus sp. ISL-4 TaxID=2819125 RepID=UPI001BEAE848|nr:hypothetical protein [Bacillus sp. ISL-4]MBT2669094.1 hypothetical protein [Bacillus sp. ISL-4]MBT2674210.1 hypothetical protein [Streptomyces sp. ISL-14]
MATLLKNLTNSLIETRQRYAMLKEHGIESMSTIYPDIPWNADIYYHLLATLPKEIDRLEQRILKIESNFKVCQ